MTTGIQATMREVFGQTVTELLDTDPRLVVVLADISAAMLEPAAARHPDRVINVGIREQLLISTASGLAMTGLRPVVHTFGSFLVERPFEQIKLDLGHQDVGAVLVSAGGSYDMSSAGRSHQSPGDVAALDTLPGWTVHVPGHPDEARRLLRAAIAGDGRVYVRLSDQSNEVPTDGDRVRVLRPGSRGVVLAVGPMLDRVLAATATMDVTVAYTATVRPLDGLGLRSAVLGADRADVVLVEPYLAGTSAYLVNAALDDVPHRLRSLGVSREFELRMYGTPSDHDEAHGLDTAGIAGAVRSFLDRTD
ncbi:MAG TPA: transketolase [Pseudonocardiaceae bacterium]|nr:transketolase [Pseudonocardiaceae bacterium]